MEFELLVCQELVWGPAVAEVSLKRGSHPRVPAQLVGATLIFRGSADVTGYSWRTDSESEQ